MENTFGDRITDRKGAWERTSMALMDYLISKENDPDDQVKYNNAKTISSNLAIELTFEKIGLFWIGVTQPLKDAVTGTSLIDAGLIITLSIYTQRRHV